MTSLLHEIEEYVMKYAEVISNVIKVDVEIVDKDMRRVAGTGIFKDKIGTINEGSVYRKVIETGKSKIIRNPREHEICKGCINRDICIEKLEISTPLIYEGEIIGVIGLVCSTDEQKQLILENLNSHLQFLYQISDFICSKVYQYNELKIQGERTKVLNKILNNVDKGVIVLDDNNRITMLNNNAMRELKLFSTDLDKEVKLADKDEYIMGGELYELTINNKSFLLVGNIIPVDFISKDYSKVFIFNNMRKINSEIYNITASEKRIGLDTIIGNSKPMKILKRKIKKIASTQSTVLITGESGTGKELVARAIHDLSDRRCKPFVAVNCSAMPEALMESELFGYVKGAFTGANPNGKIGKFELANGGVILLDEIGDMPLYMQVKLLRVLQERNVTRIGSNQSVDLDIRVLAATNLDLEERIKENKFRKDLFYRLKVIPIKIPPLREREGDIELIIDKLIEKYSILFNKSIYHIKEECKNILLKYPWPGNVRELQNTIEYMINIVDNEGILTKDMLPDNILHNHNKNIGFYNEEEIEPLEKIEQEYIEKVLDICGRSTDGKRKAAEKLGIGIATLYRKIKT
ncbi:sigma-54-dependent Fis family transcriptional regulator [Maledivibacter halophilus]|uniref:Transcriptional regulator containing PAS, AAA-type ATPase, and DNA-binding Fis domains n=1 Tax=Maledivibacter halophilus TaxID=36842 RepID=A0A1T5L3C6_9FIRM|nr:sigma 54-interacting transcriptional regulator [Maledivibacter halophilus]SKC69898.1 Transcriptional regulator containing PAS, AAA-type ATPase, and DNA-binding Fis domains [Maledivibacter halophilus]